jgi:hypothetical protein
VGENFAENVAIDDAHRPDSENVYTENACTGNAYSENRRTPF